MDGISVVEFLEFFALTKAARHTQCAHSVMKICNQAQSIAEPEKKPASTKRELKPIAKKEGKERVSDEKSQAAGEAAAQVSIENNNSMAAVTTKSTKKEQVEVDVPRKKPALSIITSDLVVESQVTKPKLSSTPAALKPPRDPELDSPMNKRSSPKKDAVVDPPKLLVKSKDSSDPTSIEPKADLSSFLNLYKLNQTKFENCFRKEAFAKAGVNGTRSDDTSAYIGMSGIEKAINLAAPNIPMKAKVDLQVY